MSTEHDYRVGSEQYEFLESDLAAVDPSLTPWIVFSGHRPMYINSGFFEMGPNGNSIPTKTPPKSEAGTDVEHADGDIEVCTYVHMYQQFVRVFVVISITLNNCY